MNDVSTLADVPIEDINTLCMAPLFIYQLLIRGAVDTKFLSGFHLIKAVDRGLNGLDHNSEELVDHLKSNMDSYYDEMQRCMKRFTAEMVLTCVARLPEIVGKYSSLDLPNYLICILRFTSHVAEGKPFSNIPNHINLDTMAKNSLIIKNILVS